MVRAWTNASRDPIAMMYVARRWSWIYGTQQSVDRLSYDPEIFGDARPIDAAACHHFAQKIGDEHLAFAA